MKPRKAVRSFIPLGIGKRNLDGHMIFGAKFPGDGTLAGEAFGNALIQQQLEDVIAA